MTTIRNDCFVKILHRLSRHCIDEFRPTLESVDRKCARNQANFFVDTVFFAAHCCLCYSYVVVVDKRARVSVSLLVCVCVCKYWMWMWTLFFWLWYVYFAYSVLELQIIYEHVYQCIHFRMCTVIVSCTSTRSVRVFFYL